MLDVVVFASGRGSNLAALIQAQYAGARFRIRAVLSDKTRAGALDIARDAGIDAIALSPRDYPDRNAFDAAMFAQAAQYAPGLIVLAGYLRIIDPALVERRRGKIINIHPSLLPKFPGLHTHRRVLEAGDARHGASVHFVTAALDGGPILAQVELPVQADDTPESLAQRLLPLEHRLLVASVAAIAARRIELAAEGVRCDGKPLPQPLSLQNGDELG